LRISLRVPGAGQCKSLILVGVAGFEPATPSSRTRCAIDCTQRAFNIVAQIRGEAREVTSRSAPGHRHAAGVRLLPFAPFDWVDIVDAAPIPVGSATEFASADPDKDGTPSKDEYLKVVESRFKAAH
jgi:hypothetical protein